MLGGAKDYMISSTRDQCVMCESTSILGLVNTKEHKRPNA